MGATYDHGVTQAEVTDVRHQENRERFCKRLPELEAALPAPKKGWASFRTVSKDRLPLVGPVANQVQLETHFSKLHQGTPGRVKPETLFLPGLYCSLAHASRGLLSTVLSGEYLAAMIAGEAMPVETDITEALHPARFYMREFRKAPEKREFSA
ncbi:MAG: FAD-dependent oxidoreductase, partial [Rickettsiales bacterium]|nr:FAD-dependent oxidoreductase [Rickettsiales bacterium]